MAYGAWGKKNLYGKEYDGILRTTYVISEKGIIEKVFSKVDTKNHTEQIFESYQ
jgi:peroxiredoxin Q/BCP